MGGLIDLILDNIFLVVLIVSGLIGVLSKNNEEQKQQEQKKPQQNQKRPTPSTTEQRSRTRTQSSSADRSRKPVRRQTVRGSSSKEELDRGTSASIAAEQQAQMESLERKYGIASSNISAEDLSLNNLDLGETLQPLDVLSEEQEKLKRNLRSNLQSKGLINGIIMAEVLGKPRSLNGYRSPTLDRYKKQ
ncbi:hypothetical protein [Oceanobacillus sp. CAU 1775]